jgi:putative ABC transport system permease protein
VLVKVRPGWDVEDVRRRISALPDVTAYTADGQREIMLGGVVARSRRQQALFRKILGAVSTVVMMLVLYTLTLDKIHDIAMLTRLPHAPASSSTISVWRIDAAIFPPNFPVDSSSVSP